jgi:hypothetical protein
MRASLETPLDRRGPVSRRVGAQGRRARLFQRESPGMRKPPRLDDVAQYARPDAFAALSAHPPGPRRGHEGHLRAASTRGRAPRIHQSPRTRCSRRRGGSSTRGRDGRGRRADRLDARARRPVPAAALAGTRTPEAARPPRAGSRARRHVGSRRPSRDAVAESALRRLRVLPRPRRGLRRAGVAGGVHRATWPRVGDRAVRTTRRHVRLWVHVADCTPRRALRRCRASQRSDGLRSKAIPCAGRAHRLARVRDLAARARARSMRATRRRSALAGRLARTRPPTTRAEHGVEPARSTGRDRTRASLAEVESHPRALRSSRAEGAVPRAAGAVALPSCPSSRPHATARARVDALELGVIAQIPGGARARALAADCRPSRSRVPPVRCRRAPWARWRRVRLTGIMAAPRGAARSRAAHAVPHARRRTGPRRVHAPSPPYARRAAAARGRRAGSRHRPVESQHGDGNRELETWKRSATRNAPATNRRCPAAVTSLRGPARSTGAPRIPQEMRQIHIVAFPRT